MPFFRPYGGWYCTEADSEVMPDLHARLQLPALGFKHLLINPTAIDEHHWELTSPEVRSVARELEYLACAVKIQLHPGLPMETFQTFDIAYNRCMVALWPTLILWLDFLHPMHHKGTSRHADVPMKALISFFYSIFVARGSEVSALRAETPHLYRLLFFMWLRSDEYLQDEVDRYSLMDILICAARSAMTVWHERVKALMQDFADEPDIIGRDLDAVLAANRHPECTAALLSAAQRRPRRVYRMAVTTIASLVDQALSHPDDKYINSSLEHQIDAVYQLAEEPLALSAHSRNTVIALVDVLRALQGLRNGGGPALGVVHLLATIWRSCEDGRSIAWAVEHGVLPIMRQLHHTADIYKFLVDEALRVVAQSTFQLRVARVFATEECAFSFRCDDYMHPYLLATVHQRISQRARSASLIYNKGVCSYQKCTDQQTERKVRRCPCLGAGYCSKECQRADWPEHRRTCLKDCAHVDYMLTLNDSILKQRRLMDVHFICICARDYLFANISTIVKSIDDMLLSTPHTRSAHAVILTIDIAHLLGNYRLSVAPCDPVAAGDEQGNGVRSTPSGYWHYEFPDESLGTVSEEMPVHVVAKVPHLERGEGIHVMAIGLASLQLSVGMWELWSACGGDEDRMRGLVPSC